MPIRPSGVYWGPWKGLANTYVVGHLGAAALAAVGLSTQRTNFLVAFFSAVGVGSTALVARQVGAREREEAERTAGQSLLLAVVVGLLAVLPCLLWGHALLTTLRQDATQANVALMTPGQQELIHAFLDAGALPDKVGYDFVQTAKEALTGLERVAVPPEDILMALTQGGMPCTVQELLSRFRSFVEQRTEGKDPNKVRIVVEWNVIHLDTMFKVDVFVAKPRAFDRSQLARRQLHLLSEDPERYAYVTTAEDIVLSKLEWYRRGGEVSDRQWRDVLGVLKVQGDRLDRDYLRRMAAELGVTDLFEQAVEEAK